MAANAIHDDAEVGFEEGMLLLPSQVLHEACRTKVCVRNRHQKIKNHQQMHQQHHHKFPAEPKSQNLKSTSRSSYQRSKLANGGPGAGMRAIFLGSEHKSCGTGVFLPQTDTKFPPSKRPACAPVLLPARVVQALNLNVHALGLQTTPPQVQRYIPGCREACDNKPMEKKNNNQKDASKQCSFISQNRSSSPEIFLPKEWTY
ncbi:hypothetical protein RJT34_22661 [Clitoria ternatea]|uniref:Uncharacterized protein n=1 Tax=Clitoria ternatea TaxID=43366 RepID=A0AAN9IKW3_CLITE